MTTTESLLNTKRAAKNIDCFLIIGKDIEGEYPFEDDVEWLYNTSGKPKVGFELAGYYLVEGAESYVTRIWHGHKNHYKALFKCIWEITDAE